MSEAATHENSLAQTRDGARAPGRRTRRARSLDLATVAGLTGALVLIGAAIAIGGSWSGFIDVPALLIVFLGTFAVTAISFSTGDLVRARSAVFHSLFDASLAPAKAASAVLKLAEECRRDGVLSLQDRLARDTDDAFLARGLALVVDGAPAAEAEAVMRTDLHATADRHEKGAAILRRAADVAPAMGLIGTLVGLVQMLGNLEDPSTIGPAMAVALLTTFYGAVLGNMVFAPLAAKLERRADEEALLNEIYLLAVASIARQDNPRRLQTLLNTILPPAQRVAYFT